MDDPPHKQDAKLSSMQNAKHHMAVKGRKALIHRLQKLLNIASETAEKAIVV